MWLNKLILAFLIFGHYSQADDSEDENVYTTTDPKKREPSPCEVCKYFVTELKERLDETGKNREKIRTGYDFDLDSTKEFDYKTSETRLIEALEDPHICDKILQYNVHAERKGSLRYAKGQSETMQTLHNLVHKGVKVVYDIPYELWNETSSEIVKMHRACFALANDYEEVIQEWYYNHQDNVSLMKYVCADRYLKGKDQKCLEELFFAKGDSEDGDDSNKQKQKKLKPKQSKQSSTSNKDKNKSKKGDKGGKDEL